MMTLKNKIALGFASLLAMFPVVSAYASGPLVGMMNMWDILVEQMFGSFWVAVIFLIIIFMIILALGGISLYTNIIFQIYFILAMSIGYGYPLFVFIGVFASIVYFVFQFIKLIMENR